MSKKKGTTTAVQNDSERAKNLPNRGNAFRFKIFCPHLPLHVVMVYQMAIYILIVQVMGTQSALRHCCGWQSLQEIRPQKMKFYSMLR